MINHDAKHAYDDEDRFRIEAYIIITISWHARRQVYDKPRRQAYDKRVNKRNWTVVTILLQM